MAEIKKRKHQTTPEKIEARKTLAQIGAELGVTRERVRQIERDALRKLRKHPLAKELFRAIDKSGRKVA